MAMNYEGVITTKKGLRLLAKLAASTEKMVFTGVKVGTGLLQEGVEPSDLSDLVSYKMDGTIADYGYDDESEDSYIVMQVINTGVQEGFIMTEIGLYAWDTDLGEILYAYVDLSDDPNYIMPSENGRSKVVQIKLHIIVGGVKEIHATVNPLAQVTREVFDREITILSRKISDLATPEYDDSGTVAGITNFNTFMDTLKSKISIFNFFRNLKAGLKYVIHTGKIINDGITTEPGFVADARQLNPNLEGTLAGKVAKLNSDLTVLNTNFTKLNANSIAGTGTSGYWKFVKYTDGRLTATYSKAHTMNNWKYIHALYWANGNADTLSIAKSVRYSAYSFYNSTRAIPIAATGPYSFQALAWLDTSVTGTICGYLEGTWK